MNDVEEEQNILVSIYFPAKYSLITKKEKKKKKKKKCNFLVEKPGSDHFNQVIKVNTTVMRHKHHMLIDRIQ